MNSNYRLIKGYKDNTDLRKSFNDLAKSVYGFDFEDWYQNGYWNDNYIPYSILDKGKVVANVSVNPMQFFHGNKLHTYIQLGTVMTDKAYRNKGLIRRLIEEIEQDYKEKTEGYFLFANDSVLEFYPKFGYKKATEYEYLKSVSNNTEMTAKRISMEEKENRSRLERAINTSAVQSGMAMKENAALILFYATKFMKENVYEIESQSALVIAELNKGVLHLHNIFAPKEVEIDTITAAFGKEVTSVVLGFAPLSGEGYEVRENQEEDTTLFIKGTPLEEIERERLRIPALSHT
ncbi:GNAT family N-acetyltransferase [Konateibacter massiliensis]|uniref:GNAT family N-acetyltransferase n=1 Tax=Konateibacter massiliensis TaxID=2002841 RepID=UPI000C153515|nr:GNAT family N-acetyltransferase [Konateibacter massiliensis]